MKELNLYGYHTIDTKVKHLEMIHESLNDKVKNYLSMMEDDGWVADIEDARKIFASFAMELRRDAHQITKVIDELKKMADKQLNEDNYTGTQKQIKSVNNYELQKQYAEEN